MIDASKELAKLEKKKETLLQSIKKLEQAIATKDYTTKVPEEVRNSNLEKLSQCKGELDRLGEATLVLKRMEQFIMIIYIAQNKRKNIYMKTV